MKKISVLLIVMISLCFTQNAFSQSRSNAVQQSDVDPVQIGSTIVNLGIGIGADYQGDNYGTAFGFKISAEFGLWQAGPGVITLGPEIGGSFSSSNYYYNYSGYHTSTFVVAGRAAWHFGWNVPNLDTYGGFSAGLGFHHLEYNDVNNTDNNSVIPVFGGFVGGTYFFKPNIGVNVEAGFDITNFQVGIVFKLQ